MKRWVCFCLVLAFISALLLQSFNLSQDYLLAPYQYFDRSKQMFFGGFDDVYFLDYENETNRDEKLLLYLDATPSQVISFYSYENQTNNGGFAQLGNDVVLVVYEQLSTTEKIEYLTTFQRIGPLVPRFFSGGNSLEYENTSFFQDVKNYLKTIGQFFQNIGSFIGNLFSALHIWLSVLYNNIVKFCFDLFFDIESFFYRVSYRISQFNDLRSFIKVTFVLLLPLDYQKFVDNNISIPFGVTVSEINERLSKGSLYILDNPEYTSYHRGGR